MDRQPDPAQRPHPRAGASNGAWLRARALRLAASTSLALLTAGLCAGSAGATVALCNVPIPMSDGVILRADLYLPSATGHYPTVLTVTGYNKDAADPTGECGSSPSQGIAG